MRVRFWGVRGSIPAPGPETARYGGNTTCIEVRSESGDLVILDGGTGIRAFGLELSRQLPVACSVFLTHTHWDHIQGLPFFVPLFVPGNVVRLHGPPDPVNMRGTEVVLETQMAYPHFPVREAELKADVEYVTLKEGQETGVGDLTVSGVLMNHPALNFGYRVEERSTGVSMFFTGDHEPFSNIYAPGEEGHAEYQEAVDTRNARVEAFARGVDLLVADAQYTDEEYSSRVGWGHASMSQAVEFARRTGAASLLLTHHDPVRTDEQLEAILQGVVRQNAESGVAIGLAREGAEILLR